MTITIPDSVLRRTGLTEAQIKLEVALALFQTEALTLAQAATVAGLHRMQFQEELAKREIPLHYGIDELKEDVKTLKIAF